YVGFEHPADALHHQCVIVRKHYTRSHESTPSTPRNACRDRRALPRTRSYLETAPQHAGTFLHAGKPETSARSRPIRPEPDSRIPDDQRDPAFGPDHRHGCGPGTCVFGYVPQRLLCDAVNGGGLFLVDGRRQMTMEEVNLYPLAA